MRRLFAALILLACAGCGSEPSAPSSVPASTPAPTASAVVVLTGASFNGQVLAGGTTWMVEFYSPTCPHCLAMVATVEKLAVDFSGRASIGKVDATVETALTQTYGVTGVPTFVFFHGGREVSRHVGETSYETLAAKLTAAQAGG